MSWLEEIANALGADRYSAHSLCLTADPAALFLYRSTNFIIAVSYMAIAAAMYHRRHVLVDLNLAAKVIFANFIAWCACSHASMILTSYVGVYLLEIAILAITAGVSAIAALYTVTALWTLPDEGN